MSAFYDRRTGDTRRIMDRQVVTRLPHRIVARCGEVGCEHCFQPGTISLLAGAGTPVCALHFLVYAWFPGREERDGLSLQVIRDASTRARVVVEQGTHEKLLEVQGLYNRLWWQQNGFADARRVGGEASRSGRYRSSRTWMRLCSPSSPSVSSRSATPKGG